MAGTATCDQCNASITEGDGYLFYSTARFGIGNVMQETGNLFCCEECANSICSPQGFAKKFIDVPGKFGDFSDPITISTKMKETNHQSIVNSCKARGLSPDQAMEKAHTLATLWWKNPKKAQRKSEKFWK